MALLFVAVVALADVERAIEPGWFYNGRSGVLGHSHLSKVPEYGWVQFEAMFSCSDSNEVYISPNFSFAEGDSLYVRESDTGNYTDVVFDIDRRATWQYRARTMGGHKGFILSASGLAFRLLHSVVFGIQIELRLQSGDSIVPTNIFFPMHSFSSAWVQCPR